jgi:hypothetical protein
MDLHHIHCVIKQKYGGVAAERNALPVDHEGPLDQTSEASVPCLVSPVRLQHCMDSSSSSQ